MSKVYIRKLTEGEKYESYKEITQPDLESFRQPRLMKGLNVNLLAFLSLLNGCPAMSHLLTAHCSQYIDYTVRPTAGKSLSEVLLFAEHGENMLCTKIVLNVRNNFCTG